MSTLKADTIQNTSGGAVTLTKQSPAKAHCTFNGVGTLSVSGASFNISTLTDNGLGLYRTNFTNAMEDENHVDAFACQENTSANGGDINRIVNYNRVVQSSLYTDLTTQTSMVTPVDIARICVVTHGDLA